MILEHTHPPSRLVAQDDMRAGHEALEAAEMVPSHFNLWQLARAAAVNNAGLAASAFASAVCAQHEKGGVG